MPTEPARPRWWWLMAIGLGAGLLSGLFGVGGGIIVTPLLMSLGVAQRRATAISLAAIVPTSIVGALGYAVHDEINWLAALFLAIGAVAGSQIGSVILHRISAKSLFWAFIAFLGIVVVSLWVVTPDRSTDFALTPLLAAGLVACGLFVGILSVMFGVGGGIVFVPALVVVFGVADLVAKGTSLAAIVPGALGGSIPNWRRGHLDLVSAGIIGLAACVMAPVGIALAFALTPLASNIAFSVLIVGMAVQLIIRNTRNNRA